MKPYPFKYVRADSLAAVFQQFEEHGDDAQILAGGQSLMPVLNMRLSAPRVLVDINAIEELHGIALDGGEVRIGALTRHREVLESEIVQAHLPLLAEAMPHVAHVAVRNCGTLGGSLALADPAAEMPACAVALGATLLLRSAAGERTVAAEDFYQGLYETERRPDEVLTEARYPIARPGYHSAFQEFARRQGDFPVVGVAARGRVERGVLSELRLVYFGCEGHARLARLAALAAEAGGRPYTPQVFAALKDALAQELDPMENMHGCRATKLHMAQVLTGRALLALVARAEGVVHG
ncbi:MAG TPA: xanthine dehydrogenase family protein subunit M [Rhodospirillales bacterium]|nr:xanthine dehydrogenase family protein subunit M [Rhodospirillales bacterium]